MPDGAFLLPPTSCEIVDGDIWTLTAKEYQEASRGKRMVYRITRNPVILLVAGPLILFPVFQRFSSSSAKGKNPPPFFG